jgi:hypothetical protein
VLGGLPISDRGSGWCVVRAPCEEEDSCAACITMGWLVGEELLSIFACGRMVGDAACDAGHQYYRSFGSVDEEVAV